MDPLKPRSFACETKGKRTCHQAQLTQVQSPRPAHMHTHTFLRSVNMNQTKCYHYYHYSLLWFLIGAHDQVFGKYYIRKSATPKIAALICSQQRGKEIK